MARSGSSLMSHQEQVRPLSVRARCAFVMTPAQRATARGADHSKKPGKKTCGRGILPGRRAALSSRQMRSARLTTMRRRSRLDLAVELLVHRAGGGDDQVAVEVADRRRPAVLAPDFGADGVGDELDQA